MSDFDYERAWIELAMPQFEKYILTSIPWQRAITEYKRLHTQDPSLFIQDKQSLDIPLTPVASILEPLRLMDPMLLALGTHINYFYSHWCPAKRAIQARELTDHIHPSGSWHLSNLIDQHLCTTLTIPRNRTGAASHRSIACHEGFIRLCFSTSNYWTWENIGPACPLILDLLSAPITVELEDSHHDSYSNSRATLIAYKSAAVTALTPYLNGDFIPWLDVSKRFITTDTYSDRQAQYTSTLSEWRDPGPYTPAD